MVGLRFNKSIFFPQHPSGTFFRLLSNSHSIRDSAPIFTDSLGFVTPPGFEQRIFCVWGQCINHHGAKQWGFWLFAITRQLQFGPLLIKHASAESTNYISQNCNIKTIPYRQTLIWVFKWPAGRTGCPHLKSWNNGGCLQRLCEQTSWLFPLLPNKFLINI